VRELQAKAHEELLGVGRPLGNDVEIEPLIEAWRAQMMGRRRPATWDNYALGLRTVLGWLEAQGYRPRVVADICLDGVEAFKAAALAGPIAPCSRRRRAGRPSGSAPRTVALRVGAVVAMLNWAVKSGRIASNPLAGWEAPKGRPVRDRRPLTEFEMGKLVDASPPPLADVWEAFLHTGLRAGELKALEWADVDADARRLRVRAETSKSRRTRFVPMTGVVVAIVQRSRLRVAERPDGEEARRVVFVNSRGTRWGHNLSRRLKPCLVAGRLRNEIDLHTLRHTFASHLVRRGCDVRTLQYLLGHSSARTTLEHYAHLFDDRAAEVVGLLEDLTAFRPRAARRARAEGT
jgi:integrase